MSKAKAKIQNELQKPSLYKQKNGHTLSLYVKKWICHVCIVVAWSYGGMQFVGNLINVVNVVKGLHML